MIRCSAVNHSKPARGRGFVVVALLCVLFSCGCAARGKPVTCGPEPSTATTSSSNTPGYPDVELADIDADWA